MQTTRSDMVMTITNECREHEINVSREFVDFMVSLLLLDPSYRDIDGERIDCDHGNILPIIIEKLLDQSRSNIVTLKAQLYFNKNYYSRDDIIARHRSRLCKKTKPLVNEIYDVIRVNTDEEIEKLYQKILVVVTLLSGLGNPTNPAVLKEVAVSMQSVFHPSELKDFVSMRRSEKEDQLKELVHMVAGIRLFNRDCQRGGEGIDDLPSILQDAVSRTQASILEILKEVMDKVYKLTAVIEKAFLVDSSKDNNHELHQNIETKNRIGPNEIDNMECIIEMLATCRQHEIYIRKLLSDVDVCELNVKTLLNHLRIRLLKLHETVQYRITVPTMKVYPLFLDIANIWMKLQDEVIVLSNINNFLWHLQSLCMKTLTAYKQIKTEDMLKGVNVLTDADRLAQSMGNLITECDDCVMYYPNTTKNFKKINLEFLGFCAWAFVIGKGALIPGNPNLGVAKWRGKYFAFSSVEAAKKFGKDPERFYNRAMKFILNRTEYVHLFQSYNEMLSRKHQSEIPKDIFCPKVVQNQGIQTDLHIISSFIEQDYTANLWEHRERALKLASLSRCASQSTQTYKSQFRTGVCIQVAPPKDSAVQTRRETGVNTRRMRTLIYGLQRPDNMQSVITYDIDELGSLPP